MRSGRLNWEVRDTDAVSHEPNLQFENTSVCFRALSFGKFLTAFPADPIVHRLCRTLPIDFAHTLYL